MHIAAVQTRWSILSIWAHSRRSLRTPARSAERTKRPCAAAAIADAAFARNRGDDFLAVQRFSPKQPFKRVNRAGSQTVFSLQVV